MKIIFDSEEQKREFFEYLNGLGGPCPHRFDGLKSRCKGLGRTHNKNNCHDCWELAIETEVKKNDVHDNT